LGAYLGFVELPQERIYQGDSDRIVANIFRLSSEKRRFVLGVVGAVVTLVTFFLKDGVSSTYSGRISAIDQALSRFDSFGILVRIGAKVDMTSNIAERILDKNRVYSKDLAIEEEQIHWNEYKHTIQIVSDLLAVLDMEAKPAYELLRRVEAEHQNLGNDIDAVLEEKTQLDGPLVAPPLMLTFRGMALENQLAHLVTVAKKTALDSKKALTRRLNIARWIANALFLLGWLIALLSLTIGRTDLLAVKPARWRMVTERRVRMARRK